MIVVLILVSRLKYDIIWMTANFLDVLIINADTISFLLAVKPDLYREVLLALALILPALALLWWIDNLRMRPRTAVAGIPRVPRGAQSASSLAFRAGDGRRSSATAMCPSSSRSGVAAISELMRRTDTSIPAQPSPSA